MGIDPITGMAIGVVWAALCSCCWQLPSLRAEGFRFRPAFNWRHPLLRKIFRLMGPAIIGNAAVQINVLVITNFASRIPGNGPVSWLGYSFRFMQLPLGFSASLLRPLRFLPSRVARAPAISTSSAARSPSRWVWFFFHVPSSVGLIVLGRTMIGAIYQGGKFSAYDTQQTALALSCYALGLAGYSALKVLNPAFYALHDARTPMIVSLLSIAVNYFTASLLFRHSALRARGLALSTAAVATFGGIALFVILRKRIGGIYGRNLIESVWKISAASAVMGGAVLLSSHAIDGWLGVGRLGNLVDLAASIPLGLLVFYAGCRLLRVSELELATRAVANPLARRG